MRSDEPDDLDGPSDEAAEDESPGGTSTLVALTPEKRRVILGKLMEFEHLLSGLTIMQQNFVLAVLADPTNHSQAATVAGFKHPSVTGTKLIKLPRIAACIALGEQLREDRTYLTTDRTLNEFAIIAFSDVSDYCIKNGRLDVRPGISRAALRAISSCEIDEHSWMDLEGKHHTRVKAKFKLHNKIAALQTLSVYQKLLSGLEGQNLTIDNRQVHIHQHQNNTWQIGDRRLTF
jgi:hypothetical protein